MVNFTFDPVKHEYRVDGCVVPSVTQVNRLAGLSDFDGVNPDLLERNQEFGTHVHKAVELCCKGTLDEEKLDEALRPYLQGWKNFVEDFGYICHAWEHQGYSEVYRFAFTIDQLGEITKGKYVGKSIGDIKTGKPKPADAVQLGGYKIGTGREYKNVFILYLDPDFKPRGYKVVFAANNKREQGIFLSALSVVNFRKEHGLI